ncbi:MAG TPA: TadE/TadG family type IV pilus assembly protein [Bryobacteraceae bacterium]|nr:TadE/TadG family type IV pilus assembly protein [Bryobacteraceae bacterium]
MLIQVARKNMPASRAHRRGNAIIEFCLIFPCVIFLFTGVFDLGFYAYAFISVKNAARVAALHGSANNAAAIDQAGACKLVMEEMRSLPNIGPSFSGSCSGLPLSVAANYCNGTTACGSSGSTADSGPAALVTVTYQMPPLFRVPIQGVTAITQTAEMRLRDTLP